MHVVDRLRKMPTQVGMKDSEYIIANPHKLVTSLIYATYTPASHNKPHKIKRRSRR